jgi:hypothetical protein
MASIIWAISGFIALGMLIFLLLWKHRKQRPTDYFSIFIMGLLWIVIGLPTQNYALMSLGITSIIVGLLHKKSWKKNRLKWKHLDDHEKLVQLALMILVMLMLAVFLIFYAWKE